MVKKTKTYFYMDTDEDKEPFVVFVVEHKVGNIDLAERKAKTIVKQFGRSLAGGWFVEGCEPYDLKDYVVVRVPNTTKPQQPTAKDKLIDTLISYENGELTEEESLKFLKKLKKSGVGQKLQGHYSSRM